MAYPGPWLGCDSHPAQHRIFVANPRPRVIATRNRRSGLMHIPSCGTEDKEGMPAPSPTTRPDVKLSEGHTSPVRISKSLAVALVEGVLLILLYGGLVAEYKSNIHMQEWVRTNIAFGGYFLNEVAILLQAAALSGVLVFH